MESLPREILKEITERVSLSCAASLAQTCKSFNGSIWSLITTLDENNLKNIKESTSLDKFNNLERLSLQATVIPQDLIKLTTLQKLDANIDLNPPVDIEYYFNLIRALTNLRELGIRFPEKKSSEKFCDLLVDHTRLTKLGISAESIPQLDPLSWEIMTRLRYLTLNSDDIKGILGFSLSKLWTLTQLRGLSLSGIILDERESGLSKLTNLEELTLDACKLHGEDNGEWMINYTELLDLKKLTSLYIMDLKLNKKLTDILAKMTQLVHLDIFEFESECALSPYSNLKNLTQLWFTGDILDSDPGLDFTQIPNLELLSVPWCPSITQLVHLKKLRFLLLQNKANKNYVLNFLNELEALQDLCLTSEHLLPSDGIVNMKGMTNLMHIRIQILRSDSKEKSALEAVRNFVQNLSVVPSLVSLGIAGDITQELLTTIATSLTQLQTLKLRNRARSLFKDDTTPEGSVLPSHKDFSFLVQFLTEF